MATSSSGLVENTDFAAELLLNKVMNGQYRAESGKTLTMAGRINAANLDATAKTYNVSAENIQKGSVIADATQDALTEMIALAKKVQEASLVTTDANALSKLGTEFSNQFAALYDTEVEGVSVLQGTTGVDLGLGGSVSVGVSGDTDLNALSTAIGTMAGGGTISQNLDDIIAHLYVTVATEGSKASLLGNRYDTLNDLAANYKVASDNQAVTEGGSPTSLLNNLL
ncbi:MAG: hypothetical protein J5846_02085 [Desulfovibrio sp.]|nr:hypothetical protein [Desulfovibrio sp.]